MSLAHWHDFDRDHLRHTALRFAAGGAFIGIAHVALVYGALFFRKVSPPAEPPPAAVMVELAPLPVSAPSQQEEVAPGPQMVQSPETVPDAPDIPEEAPPPPEPETLPMEETPEPPTLAEAVPVPVPEEVPLPPTPPVRAEVTLPEPVKQQAEQQQEKPKEEAKPKPRRKTTPRREVSKREAKPTRRKEAPTTSAAPRSDASEARRTAAPSQGSSASRSVSRASWASQVSAHLNRFKRYPPGAHGSSGRPSVRFTLNGSGRVVSVSLSRSSGNPALDAEAVATVRRASPFPRPPDGNGASFSVPVYFVSR